MKQFITEDIAEQEALEILQGLNYEYYYGPDISPFSENPLRESYEDVILENVFSESLQNINKGIKQETIDEVIKRIKRIGNESLDKGNELFHKYLIEGITLEVRIEGQIKNETIKLIDFNNINKNRFMAINQFTIKGKSERRPDIVIFVNGLPISVIELKNLADENASIEEAFNQIITYKNEIPKLFNYNELIVISDFIYAQVGTTNSNREWFLPWKSKDNNKIADQKEPQLNVLLNGMFKKNNLLDIIKNFITYSKSRSGNKKLLAGYHQYKAVNKSIQKTKEAIKTDKKIGVVWHTQGSGKSLTLAYYVGKIQQEDEMKNPTIIILTDRNDLDDQLFNTFSNLENLREEPKQAKNRNELIELLNRDSGGIIFTTIQKFDETVSNEIISKRDNIIVAADEAHRSQYGFKAKLTNENTKYGFAKYLRDVLPNASFIGFTGTPIDFEDKSTRIVFGDYIDIYDISQAVEDKRTVKIYYESRLAKLGLDTKLLNKIDEDFENITEKEEIDRKEKLKSEWSRLEEIVGNESRIKQIAKDLIEHFEKRNELMDGKAMFVCMSRRICVALHDELKKLKPEWYNENDNKGFMKIIMTGSASDKYDWQEHIRDKRRRKNLSEIFKDENSEFKLAIVRDMWLTGFDAPCMHTLYIDKPMKGHGLMQAIARVNRVYKSKQGGLVVDYLGIAPELKKALMNYSESGGAGQPTYEIDQAVNIMLDKYDIVKSMYHGFDYKKFFDLTNKEKLYMIPYAVDHILSLHDGKKRYLKEVTSLSKASSLASTTKEFAQIRDEIAFFQAIKACILKNTESKGSYKTDDELKHSMKQIMSRAISTDGVIDIFESLGMEKPEVSVLSDTFLDEVKNMKLKNLAFEALRKLLEDQIKYKFSKNVIKEKKFSELLQSAVNRYHTRGIDTAQIIQELIDLANKIKEDQEKGEELGLSQDEESFYDALANNVSAKDLLGDELLKTIAREITLEIRNNASIDWTLRDSVQARLRVNVKRLLDKYGYPPDKQKIATDQVLEQAKRFASDWSQQEVNKDLIYSTQSYNALSVAEKKKKYNTKENIKKKEKIIEKSFE